MFSLQPSCRVSHQVFIVVDLVSFAQDAPALYSRDYITGYRTGTSPADQSIALITIKQLRRLAWTDFRRREQTIPEIDDRGP
nr:hypothetical protein CFP56_52818 [Quercus suber]